MTAVPAKFAVAAAVVALAAAQRTAVTIPPNAQLTRLLSVPSPDDESSRMLRVGDEEDDICHPITRWEHLPPLPEPKRCEMRMEASGGTVLVLALVAVFTGMTQGVALGPGKLTGAWWWLFFCLIYGEAACAIGCLLGIMWGDPGVVKRSEETCFPIPAEVADRLRRGLSLEQMGNVTEDGRTYCIRCLLWRPGGLAGRSTVHHCGTCQRCVVDFDHHCGVFGRCIAGDGFAGNMGYFKTILSMAAAGAITCIAATFVEFSVNPPGRHHPAYGSVKHG